MANFAIMRSKKINKLGNVAASLKHAYRERETENADPARLAENELILSKTTSEAMGKIRELLPEKRRSDAVVAVEYLFTTSPEWMKTATPEQQAEFFDQSKKWLSDKYGAENVVATVIHRDEKTPHMSAFVVPLTADGRLSAKEHIGTREKMKSDLTNHAKAVQHLGLERGIEGSKAKHVTLKTYYAALEKPVKLLEVPAAMLEPRVTEKRAMMPDRVETPEQVAVRVNKAIQTASEPLLARVKTVELAQDKAKAEIDAATSLRAKLGGFYKAVLEGLKPNQQKELAETVKTMRQDGIDQDRKAVIEAEKQRRVDRLPDLLKRASGAALTFAQHATEAIKSAGNRWREVNWPTVEKAATNEAMHENGQSLRDSAKAVLTLSPGHADKSAVQVEKVILMLEQKAGIQPEIRRDDDHDMDLGR